ncbi:MAG: AAA family ATPase [Acidobacteriota bacterium]|nr:AAA family ATPase [Acidobacteriota bacterium]
MYEKFYGFRQNPFRMSPDPSFYYATARHNEALANLTYGVLMQKGFIVLTGEVGTGKTLLVRCLLDTLYRSRVAHAYILNPLLSRDDLLNMILTDFGVREVKRTRGEMLQQFHEFLIQAYRRNEICALVIDEAQLLTPELLEEIRLMTNIETSKHKLLQIVLVGQPELDEMLDSPELRQVKQRVALRYHLEPISDMEMRGYIERRLEVAGAPGRLLQIFPAPALARVLHYAHGIPRLVNTLCDSALVSGYGRQMASLTPQVVDEVANDLRLNLKESAMKMTGTPFSSRSGKVAGEDPGQKTLTRTLLRLAKLLDEASDADDKKNGVAG